MSYFDIIDLSERNYVAKINNSKEFMVCHYWYFNHWFNFQNSISNCCHNLLMLCFNISNITIITVKVIHYC